MWELVRQNLKIWLRFVYHFNRQFTYSVIFGGSSSAGPGGTLVQHPTEEQSGSVGTVLGFWNWRYQSKFFYDSVTTPWQAIWHGPDPPHKNNASSAAESYNTNNSLPKTTNQPTNESEERKETGKKVTEKK